MSLNDPQWGKRGNSGGPPDLDEIWRNFNRKMNELFGRSGGDRHADGGPAAACAAFPVGGAGLLVGARARSSGSPAASTSSTKAAAAS